MIMRRIFGALLLVGTACLCLLPIKTPLNIYDEGLALVGGWRLLQGEVPFRDYWALYPPGQSYALSLVFQIAGPTVIAERLYDVGVRALCALIVFLVANALLPSFVLAIITALAISLLLAAATFYGYIMFPGLLFALLAIFLFSTYLTKTRPRQLFFTGLAIGMTALFRVDVAGYVGIATLVGLLLWQWRGEVVDNQPLWRNVSWLIGGALLVVLPVYGYLAAVSNPQEIFTNLFVFPATTFRAVRHLPYPALLPDWTRWAERGSWLAQVDWVIGEWARFYLPLLIYSLVGLVLLVKMVRARLTRNEVLAVTVLLLGLGLFLQAMSRYDAIHALPTSLPTILLLGWLWQQRIGNPTLTLPSLGRGQNRGNQDLAPHSQPSNETTVPSPNWGGLGWGLVLLVFTLLPLFIYLYIPYAKLSEYAEFFPPTKCYSTLPRATCIPISQEQAAIIEWLNQLDPSRTEAVFVAARRHDQIFVNDVSLYFLAGRPIPTRYHELHPGVATTAPVQQAIIDELTQGAVPWLFVVNYPDSNEANDSAKSSGITLLDEYIKAYYQPVQQYGIYQLWQRQAK